MVTSPEGCTVGAPASAGTVAGPAAGGLGAAATAGAEGSATGAGAIVAILMGVVGVAGVVVGAMAPRTVSTGAVSAERGG